MRKAHVPSVSLLLLLSLIMAVSAAAFAQVPNPVKEARNLDVNVGYGYASGNGGLSGFNVGAAAWFSHRVAVAIDYDGGYDTSSLGLFQVTPIGAVTSKNHLQTLMMGPRVYFPGVIKTKNKTVNELNPFAELQLGASHLNSEIIQEVLRTRTGTNDTAFTWMIGGGSDIRLSPHWSARAKLGLLRTHLGNTGQSRVRFTLGVAYFFRQH